MKFDVLIPSRGNNPKLGKMIKCIFSQSHLPDKVFIAIDRVLDTSGCEEFMYFLMKGLDPKFIQKIILITNLNSDFTPCNGVSYVRNYLIDTACNDYFYFLDDDNEFDNDFFTKTIRLRSKLHKRSGVDILLSPSIMYRKSGDVQSQGMRGFNFLFSKVMLECLCDDDYKEIKMIGGNSLFGKSCIFKKIKFDEQFKFVYEDLDFTYRVNLAGYKIFITQDVKIYHMERDKNMLERSFIGDYETAYQKSKNRIIFAKKNASGYEKFEFFIFGLWFQTLWFLFLIMFFGNNKKLLMKAVYDGTIDGFKYRLK